MSGRRCHGYTLVEVLVALSIFAVLATLGYRGLDSLLRTRDRVEAETARWRAVMLFFSRLEQDLRQCVDRPVRDHANQPRPAWEGKPGLGSEDDGQLVFSRLGNADQNGRLMDTRRVGYRFHSGEVKLLLWPALDAPPQGKPEAYTVLTGVRAFSARYLSAKDRQWRDSWPIPGQVDQAIPKATEIRITLDSGEQLSRIIHLQ